MAASGGRLALFLVPLLLLQLLQTAIASHHVSDHDRTLTTYELTINDLYAQGVEPRRFDLEIGDVRNDPLISDSFSRNHDGRELSSGRKATMGAIVPSLSSGPSMSDVNGSFYRWDSVVPPLVMDWRLTPRITPIFSQFQCAACWVIAATDAVSIMWAIINKASANIASPQQVCDCGTKQCCTGGWPEYAFTYMMLNGGITSDAAYPYYSYDSTVCGVNTTFPIVAQITGFESVPSYDALALMKAVSMQPVIVFLDASAGDFQMYPSWGQVNVYNGNCSNNINHAAVVVGYNLTGSYWILKNSWAKSWADKGYGYINMVDGPGKCGMLTVPPLYPVYYPVGPTPVQFGSTGDDDDDDAIVSRSYSTTNQGNGKRKGKYKTKGSSNGQWWKEYTPSTSDACTGFINPCGGGNCSTQNGIARCKCPSGFVEVLGLPTSKCVSATPCNKTLTNPCGSGTCKNTGDGSYTCSCSSGYAIGSRADGFPTCVGGLPAGGGVKTYTTLYNDNCTTIQSRFGVSNTTLVSFNPFLNCSVPIPPGISVIISNTTTGACGATYSVQSGDTCSSIANASSITNTTLLSLNPGLNCNSLLVMQQLCVRLATAATQSPRVCGQSYAAMSGDSCASIQGNFQVSDANFAALNPGLNCNKPIPVGYQICVKNASAVTTNIICTKYYQVLQGDNCPTIWNAANLSMIAFFELNPGIQCQVPNLQVGQLVCIDSPLAASLAQADVINRYYTTESGDTFYTISSYYSFECSPATISPGNLATVNGFNVSTVFLSGVKLQIPCMTRSGIVDCGCQASITSCGTDSISYNSYCTSACNYATPQANPSNCPSNPSVGLPTCDQSSPCNGRAGLKPNMANPPACTCPYAEWPPPATDSSQMFGNIPCAQCLFANQTCTNMCQAEVSLCKQLRSCIGNFANCWGNCMSCSVKPCGGPQLLSGGALLPCLSTPLYCVNTTAVSYV